MAFQLVVQAPHDQDCRTLSTREWREECIIGRGAASHFRLTDQRRLISSRHAKISQQMDAYVLMDIGSTNGTLLNNSRLEVGKPYPLADHDQIEIGDFTLEFVLVKNAQPVVDIDDPDATLCFQVETLSPADTLVEQLQKQYVEMMQLPAEEREQLLAETLRHSLAASSAAEQEQLLSYVEHTFGAQESPSAFPAATSYQVSPENNVQRNNLAKGNRDGQVRASSSMPLAGTEQEQVLHLLLEFLNVSMKGRMQFEKELDVPVTRILGKERQELKWAENSSQIHSFLFDHHHTPLPFPEKLDQLQQVLQDLTLHPVGLMAGFRDCVRFLLKQLDPNNLEIECQQKKKNVGVKAMALGMLSNRPVWEHFKDKHRRLREEEIKTFHQLLGPELAKGYLRAYQQKMPSSS